MKLKPIFLIFISVMLILTLSLGINTSKTISVNAATSTVSGKGQFSTGTYAYSIEGQDNNQDGFIEYLKVTLDVDNAAEQGFNFRPLLLTADQKPIASGAQFPPGTSAMVSIFTLNPGKQSIVIYFDGNIIRENKQNGPYIVQLLFQNKKMETITIDTPPFAYRDFQGQLIESATIQETLINPKKTKGNSFLRLTSQLDLTESGSVDINGRVMAGEKEVYQFTGTLNLSAGSHSVNFDIPGPVLYASRLNGAYELQLTVTDRFGYSIFTKHSTAKYQYTQFQRPVVYFQKIKDSGIDKDNNKRYDQLMIEAEVYALKEGRYRLSGVLKDSSGSFLSPLEEKVISIKAKKSSKVTFKMDGSTISRLGLNGPYEIELYITDSKNSDLGYDALIFTTRRYLSSDFEKPRAQLTGDLFDKAIDTDGDGFFELLRLSVGISVNEPGKYQLEATLFTKEESSSSTFAKSEQIFEKPGNYLFTIDFTADQLLNLTKDGPYRISNLILNTKDGEVDSRIFDDYLTKHYLRSQFRPAKLHLLGNFKEYTKDANGNGLKEELIIEMDVYIPKDGEYYCNTPLYDSKYQPVAQYVANTPLTLKKGTAKIILTFKGSDIRKNRQNGPYFLDNLSLYPKDNHQQYLEWQMEPYQTASYRWEEFE